MAPESLVTDSVCRLPRPDQDPSACQTTTCFGSLPCAGSTRRLHPDAATTRRAAARTRVFMDGSQYHCRLLHMRTSCFLPLAVFAVGVPLFASASFASTQGGQAGTPPYAPADIAYGARLYAAQCTTCHGSNGDGVGGVDLRSGRFRNAVTDQDLRRVITTGIPGTGMLAFRLDAAELDGIVAYLRNINAFDRSSVT